MDPGIHGTQPKFCFPSRVRSGRCFLLLRDLAAEDTHLKPGSCLFPPLVSAVLTFLLHVVWAVTFLKLPRAVLRRRWRHLPGPSQGVHSRVTE